MIARHAEGPGAAPSRIPRWFLLLDGRVVALELFLTLVEGGDDRIDVVLAGAVLIEVVPNAAARAEREDPEQLAGAEEVALRGRVEVLHLMPQVQQRAAHGGVLREAAVLHRSHGLVEQPVRDGCRGPDVVIAEPSDIAEPVSERLTVDVERHGGVEVSRHHLVELRAVRVRERDRPGRIIRRDRRHRGRGLEYERRRGRGRIRCLALRARPRLGGRQFE